MIKRVIDTGDRFIITYNNGKSVAAPKNESVSYYNEVLEWEAKGNQIEPYEQPEPTLDQIKTDAKNRIDREAEQARMLYLTDGSGQAQEYMATHKEAERIADMVADDLNLDPNRFPMILAEVEALNEVGSTDSDGNAWTVQSVAESILQNEIEFWTQKGAEIKKIRRKAKIQIDQAQNEMQVAAIVNAVSYPSPDTD